MMCLEMTMIALGAVGYTMLINPLILLFNVFTVFALLLAITWFVFGERIIDGVVEQLHGVELSGYPIMLYVCVISNAIASIAMFSIGEWFFGIAWVCIFVEKVALYNEITMRMDA